MSKKQKKINDCLRLTDQRFKLDKNSIRIHTSNNLEHELAKTILVYEYVYSGYDVYTEVRFKSGGRADILVPELFLVIEILNSETEREALQKLDYYPEELNIKFIKTVDILKRKEQ